jgi:hypothetical protein
MTRVGLLLSVRVATWMDREDSGYAAPTADPSTSLRFGRDDKGEGGFFPEGGDLDGRSW